MEDKVIIVSLKFMFMKRCIKREIGCMMYLKVRLYRRALYALYVQEAFMTLPGGNSTMCTFETLS